MLTRRQLLSGILLSGGLGCMMVIYQGLQLSATLSFEECLLIDSVGETLFGVPTIYATVETLLTEYLASDITPIFRYTLKYLNDSTLLTHQSYFVHLPLIDRKQVLTNWSQCFPERLLYDMIKFVLGQAYYNQQPVRENLGWVSICDIQ